MRTMTLANAKARLSHVIDQVEQGEEIIITRRGRPVARIVRESPRTAKYPRSLIQDLRDFLGTQSPQPQSAEALIRELRDDARY